MTLGKNFWIGFLFGALFLELLNIFNPGDIMSKINSVFGNLNPGG